MRTGARFAKRISNKRILRANQTWRSLLEQTSRVSEVRRRELGRTWLEGEEWTNLNEEDTNEEKVGLSSGMTDADDWVNLGARGEGS